MDTPFIQIYIFNPLSYSENTFTKMSSFSWNKLTLQVTLLFQQTNDPTIRLEITEGQISLLKTSRKETPWLVAVRKIGREVINAWDDSYEEQSDILSNKNIIRNCWNEIKASKGSANVLATYFEIRKCISQYITILQNINSDEDSLTDLLSWLQQITELH